MIQKIKYKLKTIFFDLLFLFGRKLEFKKFFGAVRVLCFHGVCENNEPYINGRMLHKAKFEKLLLQLSPEVHFLTLDDYINQNFKKDKLNILLTFDDGYRNIKTQVIPIVETLNIPITLFVTANTQHSFWMDLLDIAEYKNEDLTEVFKDFPFLSEKTNQERKKWLIDQSSFEIERFTRLLSNVLKGKLEGFENFHQLLNESELNELSIKPNVAVANHSNAHLNYLVLDKEALKSDILSSMAFLNKIEGAYPNVFAYPFGLMNSEIEMELVNMGVELQFGLDDKSSLSVARLTINPFISVNNQILAILNDKY